MLLLQSMQQFFAAEWSYRLIYALYYAELKKNAQACIYSLADLNVIL